MRLIQILTEANVTQVSKLDKWLAYLAEPLQTEQSKNFFTKTLRKQILNDEIPNTLDQFYVGDLQQMDDWGHRVKIDPWLGNLNHNEVVYSPNTTGIQGAFEHLSHWLQAVENDLRSEDQQVKLYASRTLSKLYKMKYVDAERESQAYYRRGTKGLDMSKLSGRELVMQTGEYYWYLLLDQNAYQEEGKFLQNCIGTYYRPGGNNKIYVMKDKTGASHIAVRIYQNRLSEVKGKNNKQPIVKYQIPVVQFLNAMNPDITYQSCDGFSKIGNRLFTSLGNEIAKILTSVKAKTNKSFVILNPKEYKNLLSFYNNKTFNFSKKYQDILVQLDNNYEILYINSDNEWDVNTPNGTFNVDINEDVVNYIIDNQFDIVNKEINIAIKKYTGKIFFKKKLMTNDEVMNSLGLKNDKVIKLNQKLVDILDQIGLTSIGLLSAREMFLDVTSGHVAYFDQEYEDDGLFEFGAGHKTAPVKDSILRADLVAGGFRTKPFTNLKPLSNAMIEFLSSPTYNGKALTICLPSLLFFKQIFDQKIPNPNIIYDSGFILDTLSNSLILLKNNVTDSRLTGKFNICRKSINTNDKFGKKIYLINGSKVKRDDKETIIQIIKEQFKKVFAYLPETGQFIVRNDSGIFKTVTAIASGRYLSNFKIKTIGRQSFKDGVYTIKTDDLNMAAIRQLKIPNVNVVFEGILSKMIKPNTNMHKKLKKIGQSGNDGIQSNLVWKSSMGYTDVDQRKAIDFNLVNTKRKGNSKFWTLNSRGKKVLKYLDSGLAVDTGELQPPNVKIERIK